MFPSIDRRWLMAGIIVVLVLGAALPASAYDKLWRFWKPGSVPEDGDPRLRAFTNAMEVVTGQYSGWHNPWSAEENVDYVLKSGAYCTRILYNEWDPDPEWTSWDDAVKIGWNTSDDSCRLNDLKWVYDDPDTGENVVVSITAEDVGCEVDGGGYLWWDDVEGVWKWTIVNDIGLAENYPLQLSGLEVGVFDAPLAMDDEGLGEVADLGITGKRLSDIDKLMAWLEGEITWAEGEGLIPSPSANSLLRKVLKARDYMYAALAEYDGGDPEQGDVYRDRAIKAIASVISEISNMSEKGNVPDWLIYGDEEYSPGWLYQVDTIMAGLAILPGAEDLTDAPPLLPPGGTYTFPLSGVGPGDALVLHGTVFDGAGNVLVDWVEQVEIKADMTPPTVSHSISSALDPVNIDGVDVYVTPPTVTLTSSEAGSILVAKHEPMENGDVQFAEYTGPLTITDDGDWVVAYMGIDMEGNTSDVETVTIHVLLDETPPVIDSFAIEPETMWPPDHDLYEVTFVGSATDDWLPWHWEVVEVTSNQPVLGTGDGDTSPDWVIVVDNDPSDGIDHDRLWVRSERSGNEIDDPLDPTRTRVYTVKVVAVDLAGNESEAQVKTVTITHDIGT